MNILLIGPPGAGKGSQAGFLVSKKNFEHVSTGDLFRLAIEQGLPLGKKAREYMDKGQLVPDSITIGLVQDFVQKTKVPKLIFDGFPRTIPQAQALDKILQERKWRLDCALFLEVPSSKIIDRLSGRRWAPKSKKIYHIKYRAPRREGYCDESGEKLIQRPDDKPEVVLSRWEVFQKDIHPLLEYYEKKGILKRVQADASPEQVSKLILQALENKI